MHECMLGNNQSYEDCIMHVSIKGCKAICDRCGDKYVGKLKDCEDWAIKHSEECKGITCEKCGHVYEGHYLDKCPKCGYRINDHH